MLLSDIILRIRQACPLFEGRVAGTQNFVAATSVDTDIGVPCCFVVPMSDTATGHDGNRVAQEVTERFATVICADNSKDARYGRGLSADTILRQGRAQLVDALLGWAPLSMPQADTITYARSQHLQMNNARIWHQYEWTIRYYMSTAYAFDNPSYNAIERIIQGNFPEIDPQAVKAILVNAVAGQPMDPSDPDSYHAAFQALTDSAVPWIRRRPIPTDRPVGAESVENDPQVGHVEDYQDPRSRVEPDLVVNGASYTQGS